jgi:hypothetical protein
VDIATVRGLEIAKKIEKECTMAAAHHKDMLAGKQRAEEKAADARKKEGEAAAAAAAAAAAKKISAAADIELREGEDFAVKLRAERANLEVVLP